MEHLHETVPLPLELEYDKRLHVAAHAKRCGHPAINAVVWWLGISGNGSRCTASYVASRDMLLILQSLQLFV